jgi:hypothetical protein
MPFSFDKIVTGYILAHHASDVKNLFCCYHYHALAGKPFYAKGTQLMQRPIGITLLAILAILGGIIGLCGGCVLMGFGSIAGPIGALFGGGQLGAQALLAGISWSLGAILFLAAGFGMLSLQPWSWWLGLIGAVWSLASSLWGITQGGSWCLALPGLLLPALVVIYLLTPKVRFAFGRS